MEFLAEIFVYLIAAAIAVPVAARIGLGSVLGYLIAGVALGPALGMLGEDAEDVMHFSEFGVVMMLFLIGLELRPRELWAMRHELLGLGAAQVFASIGLLGAAAYALGMGGRESLAIGMVLALSSTAIVLQTLQERGLERCAGGRASISVLLFQDIVVIPFIALMPLLAVGAAGLPAAEGDAAAHAMGRSALDGLPALAQAGAILGVIALIVLAGKYLAYPIFRYVASGRTQEAFTAAALALVIGTALLMEMVGLSHALGAFVAGVVLSGSEFRHELESDIAPFKGLLLGIFFISVGAGVDFGLLAEQPLQVIGAAAGIIALKGAVLLGLALIYGFWPRDRWLFVLALPQAGEFGFVLLALAAGLGALSQAAGDFLTLVIAATMFLTPALFILFERVVAPLIQKRGAPAARKDDEIEHRGPVIIAGIGRFGQIVNRMLRAQGLETVVLDHDARQLDTLRKFGVKAYYGDASRPALLEAAGIAEARVFIATFADREKQLKLVREVSRRWPHIQIIARAYDRNHAYRLLKAGADVIIREMLGGSIDAGRQAMMTMGVDPYRADRLAKAFKAHDEETFEELRALWSSDFADNEDYVARARAKAAQLEAVMRADHLEEAQDSGTRPKTGKASRKDKSAPRAEEALTAPPPPADAVRSAAQD